MNKHTLNDDAVCTKCGFDAAEHHWLTVTIARAELGDDEWRYRKQNGEYDPPPCIVESSSKGESNDE